MKRLCALVLAGGFFCVSYGQAMAQAQTKKVVRGSVVERVDNEVYLSLGVEDTVKVGLVVRFKHELTLKHPITKQSVSDWLPVGYGQVRYVQPKLCVVHVSTEQSNQIQVGDIAEVLTYVDSAAVDSVAADTQTVPPVVEAPKAPAPEIALPVLPPEQLAVLRLWRGVAGQSIAVRIRRLKSFVESQPSSPYRAAIEENLSTLYKYQTRLRDERSDGTQVVSVVLNHETPDYAQVGVAIPLVFVPELASEIATAWLHYRRKGAATYKRSALKFANGRYLRGEIPSSSVAGEAMEFFVDVGTQSGAHGSAIGNARHPREIQIASMDYISPLPTGEGRSRLSFSTSFLDFATFDDRPGTHTDTLMITEGDMLYRLRRRLYAVRMGFGVVQRRGGFEDRVYEDDAPRSTYQYGFAELEFRAAASVALITRLVAGSGEDGFQLGGKARIRLGPEEESNLSTGISVLPSLGVLGDVRMQWKAIDVLPLGLSVGLTDPMKGDLGVRFAADIGWQVLHWLRPTLRVSYQGRSVEHSGAGVGLGVVFDW